MKKIIAFTILSFSFITFLASCSKTIKPTEDFSPHANYSPHSVASSVPSFPHFTTSSDSSTDHSIASSDLLTNTAWLCTDDNSEIIFQLGSYAWYQNTGETDDNYFKGTFIAYCGEDAIEYLVNEFPNSSFTKEKLLIYIERKNYTIDEFICIEAIENSFVYQGVEMHDEPYPKYYYGFLANDKSTLEFENLENGSASKFIANIVI